MRCLVAAVALAVLSACSLGSPALGPGTSS